MGEVYRAFDTRRQRTVALKRLRPGLAADAEYQERFRRESQLAARLSSPHVIPIHDFGEIDGRLFIDMRLAVGDDLGRQLDESGPLPPGRAVEIVRQIADALDSAHDVGLYGTGAIHRRPGGPPSGRLRAGLPVLRGAHRAAAVHRRRAGR
jgi:serine/threonine-protein kinase